MLEGSLFCVQITFQLRVPVAELLQAIHVIAQPVAAPPVKEKPPRPKPNLQGNWTPLLPAHQEWRGSEGATGTFFKSSRRVRFCPDVDTRAADCLLAGLVSQDGGCSSSRREPKQSLQRVARGNQRGTS